MPLAPDVTPHEIVDKIVAHARHARAAREMGLAPDTEQQREFEMVVSNTFVLLLLALGYELSEVREMLG